MNADMLELIAGYGVIAFNTSREEEGPVESDCMFDMDGGDERLWFSNIPAQHVFGDDSSAYHFRIPSDS